MTKLLAALAIGGLALIATPAQRADATSLINPGISTSIAAQAAQPGVTEVRWRYHRHHWRRHHHWRHHHWRHHRWHHRRY
jgi:hypothetical protein